MAAYSYQPLLNEDIRLISLFPGAFSDAISFSLTHENLPASEPSIYMKRASKADIQKTLKGNWKVFDTPDGGYIYWPGTGVEAQREHPRRDIDRKLYSIDHHLLSQPCSSFEALSYVWGSMDNPEIVYVTSGEGNRRFKHAAIPSVMEIGANLASVLRHLRYPNKERKLWVDAVSINQKDVRERELQVRRMARIYGQANRVVAWIGPNENGSELAVSTLSYLARQVEISTDRWIFRASGAAEPEWWRSSFPLPYDKETEEALTAFYAHPWFERLWVMQEIRMGSRRAIMQLGTEEIHYSIILRATTALAARVGLPHKLREGIQSSTGITHNLGQITLPELFRNSRARKCTDPKDKIYGLLSLAPSAFTDRIQPQYSRSAAEIYKNAFCISVEISHRLDLLPQSGSPRSDFGGPSWVPDWAEDSVWRITFSSDFQAAGISRSECHYSEKSDVLKVLGVRCTSVRSVIEPTTENTNRMFQTLDPVELRVNRYPTGESLVQAYARVLQLDRCAERYPNAGALPKLQTFIETFPENLSSTWSHRMMGAFSKEAIIPSRFLSLDNRLCGFGQSTVRQGEYDLSPSLDIRLVQTS